MTPTHWELISMFFRLFLLFTILPLTELYTLIAVGQKFGPGTALGLVLLTGVVGAALVKAQGVHVWQKIQIELSQGRFPGSHLIDGFLLVIAGVVLITPGLITDSVGFLLLIPTTRNLVKEALKKKLREMIHSGNVRMTGFIR